MGTHMWSSSQQLSRRGRRMSLELPPLPHPPPPHLLHLQQQQQQPPSSPSGLAVPMPMTQQQQQLRVTADSDLLRPPRPPRGGLLFPFLPATQFSEAANNSLAKLKVSILIKNIKEKT